MISLITQPRIFVSHHLPVERYEFWRIRPAHPLVIWLSKWLWWVSPWDWFPTYHEVQSTAYMINGDIYVSPQAYHELQQMGKLR